LPQIAFSEQTLHHNIIKTGAQILETSLPYPGDIMVHVGEKVKPSTQLGQNTYGPPRIYVLQMMSVLGPAFTPELFNQGVKVAINDRVEVGQVIFKLVIEGFLTGHNYIYDSNVHATVTNIDSATGTIILREIQDYSTKPYSINIAQHLGMMPKYVRPYLKKHLGDFVNAGEVLAIDLKKGLSVKSTHTGTVINIDWKEAVMTIQYLQEPHNLMSNINGSVKSIEDDRHFVLEYDGIDITGIIGFGHESGGLLYWSDSPTISGPCNDKVLVIPGKPSHFDLEEFSKLGISGLIVPSIDGDVLSAYIDGEIGVALTGNEKVPFPIIVMEGFGEMHFMDNIRKLLQENEGKYAYLKPKTQIRAGVIRPQIIIT